MALRTRKPRAATEAPDCGHEAVIGALQEQIHAIEGERDAARAGIAMMERALRRRGCCDSH